MTDQPPILDHLRWQALSARLDDLAAARIDLAVPCAAIRAPVDTLDRLWRDALPALRGDVLAAERLGALIAAAIPAAALVETAHKAAELARKTKLSEDHEPGLLRIGELAVLALAAARVAPSGLVAMYAATIHGLALQAAPAEILAQLEPHGPPRDTLGDLVARLMPLAIASGAADRLVLERFIYNRFELGRWHCLDQAFTALGLSGKAQPGEAGAQDLSAWSPATADKISGARISGAGEVTISGALPWTKSDKPVVLGATVIADAGGVLAAAALPGTITALGKGERKATFTQPIEWVGYAVPSGIDRARALRDRMRRRIAEIAGQPCVHDDQLPALIPDVPPLEAMTEAPPRRTDNRVIGAPTVSAWVMPSTIRAGEVVTLAWQSDGKDVQITAPGGAVTTGPGAGTCTFRLKTPGPAVFRVVARDGALASPPRPATVLVTAGEDRTGEDGGNEDGHGDDNDNGDAGGGGDGEGGTDRVLTFVVFRPHLLDDEGRAAQVSLEEARAAVERAAALLDAQAILVELPWAEDGLAVIASSLHGCDDPRVTRLFEELDRAAARTPNREHAIWLALLPSGTVVPPSPPSAAVVRSAQAVLGVARPGEAALGVVVASPAGAPAAIASLIEALSGTAELAAHAAPTIARRARASLAGTGATCAGGRGAAARLRIIGALDDQAVRLIDTPRLDDPRSAGPGAPEPLGLSAVCCDAGGRELARTAIRGHRSGNAAFVALVPISDAVARVELRYGDRTALRIERPTSPLELGPVEGQVDAGRMSVRWQLAAGSALEAVLEAATVESDDWVPITALVACRERNLAPAWRLPPNVVLRVVATDGWNVAVSRDPIAIPESVRTGPYVIRRAADRVLWAELPGEDEPGPPVWRAPPGAIARDRIVRLPPASQGNVELEIAGVVDSFILESRDGQRCD